MSEPKISDSAQGHALKAVVHLEQMPDLQKAMVEALRALLVYVDKLEHRIPVLEREP